MTDVYIVDYIRTPFSRASDPEIQKGMHLVKSQESTRR